MDNGQLLFNIVVGVAGTLGGFILHAVWNALKDLQTADKLLVKDIASLQILVAGEYPKRSEFEKLGAALCQKLDAIYDKLDAKQDKVNCPLLHQDPSSDR